MRHAEKGQEALEEQTMRKGESYRHWYRSDRVFLRDSQWYIRTREGIEVGPYACQFDAAIAAAELIRKLQAAPENHSEQIIRAQKNLAGSPQDLTSTEYTEYAEELSAAEISKLLETLRTKKN